MVRVAALITALAMLGPRPSCADETITSDTVVYCHALAARMRLDEVPPNVRVLLIEGRSMCERGMVMGGLRRIRLAMMIVRGRTTSPP